MCFVRVPHGQPRPKRPKHERFRCGEGSLGPVTDQDTFNYARVQRGMESSAFEKLLLGDQENRVAHMHRALDGYLYGDGCQSSH